MEDGFLTDRGGEGFGMFQVQSIYCALYFCFCSLVAQLVKSLPAVQETRVHSLGQEDPLEKEMEIQCSTVAGEFYGQRSLAGYSPWDPKESEMTGPLTLFTYLY